MSPELVFWFALTTKMAVTAPVRERSDHHRRKTRRRGGSARGDAASLCWTCLCVFGARPRFDFHFGKRGREPRTEHGYSDFYNGLRTDRTTTLTMDQRASGNYRLARGHFGRPLSIRSQSGCLRSVCVDRQTV